MKKKQEERIAELEKQKKVGEKRIFIPKISGLKYILLFLAVAAASFVLGRIFTSQIAVLMFTNIFSMLMVAYLAKILIYTQDACVLITNKRIYGKTGQKDFNIFYYNVKNVYNYKKGILIDTGSEHESVYLRYLTNKEETYDALIDCINKKR